MVNPTTHFLRAQSDSRGSVSAAQMYFTQSQVSYGQARRQRDNKSRNTPARRQLAPKLLAQIRAEGFGRSYVQKQIRKKTLMVFARYGETLVGVIIRRLTYTLDVLSDGKVRRIEKMSIKYMYKRNQAYQILPHIVFDEALKCRKLDAIVPKSDRFHVEDNILNKCCKDRILVTATLHGGEIVTGLVAWFSRYEIKINITNMNGVVIFRHGLYDFRVNG